VTPGPELDKGLEAAIARRQYLKCAVGFIALGLIVAIWLVWRWR
jgi:hypothetical protein